jgi:hypothetical protein
MQKLGTFYDDVLDIGWSIPFHVAAAGFLLGAFGQLRLGLVLMAALPLGLAAVGIGFSLDVPEQSASRERFVGTVTGLGWLLMWVGAGVFTFAGLSSFNS